MTTLVTGGTGFIGQRLVSRLLERGESVRVLARKSSNLAPFDGKPVEVVYGDVTDRPSVEAAVRGCQRLYHLANLYDWWLPDYRDYHRVNVEGTRNVLEAALAAGVERAVYTGSAVAVRSATGEVANEDTPHPGYFSCEYERSKYLGEQEAIQAFQEGLPVVRVLPTGVYGPGDTKVVGRFIVAYLNGRLPALINVKANMVYVDDVVEGHLAAMERGVPGERYILAGDNASSSEIIAIVMELEGRRFRPPILPYPLALAAGLMYQSMSRVTGKPPLTAVDFVRFFSTPWWLDNTKARTQLGLTFTPLREGLRRYLDWLHATGQVKLTARRRAA